MLSKVLRLAKVSVIERLSKFKIGGRAIDLLSGMSLIESLQTICTCRDEDTALSPHVGGYKGLS
jgi:hypothetical protein